MKKAGHFLKRDYEVQVIPIEDTVTRALFEIYAATALGTKFNDFEEH